jgi:ribosomal protein S20
MASHTLIKEISNLQSLLKEGCIVEIGSARESIETSSTKYFNDISKKYGVNFYSIDFSEYCYGLAKSLIGNKAILGKGEEKIQEIKERISVLYLDNFDTINNPTHESSLRTRIKKFGNAYEKNNVDIEKTNLLSQKTHLTQAQSSLPKLSANGVVIFDDTPRSGDGFSGKGGLAVPWLVSQGFKILHTQGSGVLLRR